MSTSSEWLDIETELVMLGLRVIRNDADGELRGGYKEPSSGGLVDWFQIVRNEDRWVVAVEPSSGQVAPKFRFDDFQEARNLVLTHYRDGVAWPRPDLQS